MNSLEITPGHWEIVPYGETEDGPTTGYLIIPQGHSPVQDIADVGREADARAIVELPVMMELLELFSEAENPELFDPLQSRARSILAKIQGKS